MLTELEIKPVNILGIVESSDNSVKPHLSLSIDEGKIMIQSSSPENYILRQHPHWFNFLNVLTIQDVSYIFTDGWHKFFLNGASDSGNNQLPKKM